MAGNDVRRSLDVGRALGRRAMGGVASKGSHNWCKKVKVG